MRRDANDRRRLIGQQPAAFIHQHGKAVDIVDETPLQRLRRTAAEAGMGIKHGQQRERDSGHMRGRNDAGGKLGDLLIRCAGDIMMDVVKFTDPGKARLQHVDISLGSDCFDVLRRHAFHEAVHQLAPSPKIVGGRAANLGKSRHAALKCVAVDVAQSGQAETMPLVPGSGPARALDLGNPPGFETQPHILCPALGQQRVVEEKPRHACLRSRAYGQQTLKYV